MDQGSHINKDRRDPSFKPDYYISKLGLPAFSSENLPDLSDLRHIGSGAEGDVYLYRGKNGPKVIKVFHTGNPDSLNPNGDDYEDELSVELSKEVMAVVTNARFADTIIAPQTIIDTINCGEDRLRGIEYAGYHLPWLYQSYPRVRDLNLRGFSDFLRQRAVQLRRPDVVVRIPDIRLPEDYKGGIVKLINYYVGWAAQTFPELMLPERIFPDMPAFGQFPSDYRPSRLAGRMFLIMEYVPGNLMEMVRGGLDILQSDIRRGVSSNGISGASDVIRNLNKNIPQNEIGKVHVMLSILASMGLTFGDLKMSNIGFKDGKSLLLDPSSIVKTGAMQDFYTLNYLPPHVRATVDRIGMLKADPNNDFYALDKIVRLVKGGILKVITGAFSMDDMIAEERHQREEGTIRAAKFRK